MKKRPFRAKIGRAPPGGEIGRNFVKQALYIDCCIRGGASRTKRLAEAFFAALPETWQVTTLNLMEEDPRPLTGESLAGRDALLLAGRTDDPRFDRARQLAKADLIVIAAPFWDMSFPALLKIYIENVSVEGITFRSTAEGLIGLCKAERCVFLTTRGGTYPAGDPLEQAVPYLRAIQLFFGFGALDCVAADGLDLDGADAEALVAEARARAAALARTL